MSPGTTETTREAVREAYAELAQALDGMDYCLDWRPQEGEWSAREIVSHLLVREQVLNEAIRQALRAASFNLELPVGQHLLAPERREQEMPDLRAELDQCTAETTLLLSAIAERRLQFRSAPGQSYLEDVVAAEYQGHWPEHIRQLSEIRRTLGL